MRADASSAASGSSASTRFTTIAETRRPASSSAPINSRACAIRLDSAVVTITIAVSGRAQLVLRARGASGEAFVHAVETADERLHVAQQIQSRHAIERRQHCARRDIHHAKLALEQSGGRAEQADGARVEQFEQAPRRVEEVDRLGRGRSVEH